MCGGGWPGCCCGGGGCCGGSLVAVAVSVVGILSKQGVQQLLLRFRNFLTEKSCATTEEFQHLNKYEKNVKEYIYLNHR